MRILEWFKKWFKKEDEGKFVCDCGPSQPVTCIDLDVEPEEVELPIPTFHEFDLGGQFHVEPIAAEPEVVIPSVPTKKPRKKKAPGKKMAPKKTAKKAPKKTPSR